MIIDNNKPLIKYFYTRHKDGKFYRVKKQRNIIGKNKIKVVWQTIEKKQISHDEWQLHQPIKRN